MADLLPPWSIDSLDNLKASFDDLTLTLDSPLYETSVTRWDAYGSVTAQASVSADGTRVQFAAGTVSASVEVAAQGIRVQIASGSIRHRLQFLVMPRLSNLHLPRLNARLAFRRWVELLRMGLLLSWDRLKSLVMPTRLSRLLHRLRHRRK